MGAGVLDYVLIGCAIRATVLLEWAVERGLRNLHIEPGKPWQNSTNESFNGKFREMSA